MAPFVESALPSASGAAEIAKVLMRRAKAPAHREIPPGERISGTQSVYRAIAVLRGVARSNAEGITASMLARELDLTLATTHRLLKVLAGEGLLTFDPYSKKYHLGLELYVLGIEAHYFGLRELLAGPMERVRARSGETVFLLVRSGADALCLERLDGDFPIRALTLTIGSRRPLGVGAGGLALLAAEPDEVVERVLIHNRKHYADYADFTPDEIRTAVTLAREYGSSFNDGRLRDDVRAVGLAIGPAGKMPVAAVSVATNQARMEESRRADLHALLKSELETIDWRLFRAD